MEALPPPAAWDPGRAAALVEAHQSLEGPLLPMLHALQAAFGCVPPAAVPIVAAGLNLSRAEVHGVVSFYHDFRSEPAGRHVLKLCRAEACQARGGRDVEARARQALGVDFGATTADGAVTLEAVYCLGLCASGPAALVDGAPLARLSPQSVEALIAECLA